jgi:endonuclease/exonuclease/phosphatase family metal-dependent hydrolase
MTFGVKLGRKKRTTSNTHLIDQLQPIIFSRTPNLCVHEKHVVVQCYQSLPVYCITIWWSIVAYMKKLFRVVTWNLHYGKVSSLVWDYLFEINPDIVLLQEVGILPAKVSSRFSHYASSAIKKDGTPQRFKTAILVQGCIEGPLLLSAPEEWMATELKRFDGNLVAGLVVPENGPTIKVISVYSPAWEIERTRVSMYDLTEITLPTASGIWLADLLWASLKHMKLSANEPWIIAGDFNLSETFDTWKIGKQSNRAYLQRMRELGLTECLREFQGQLTPTYQNVTRGNPVIHQMDHLFATQVLADNLVTCYTGEKDIVFGKRLSDHLPIIADFTL